MREILFRGLTDIRGEQKWVYGDLIQAHSKYIREGDDTPLHTIKPGTLGQYTGLLDKNGVRIFEGDIVRCTDDADEMNGLDSDTGLGQVEWIEKYGFWNISNVENDLGQINNIGHIEVLGNIFENPELLEVE